MVSVRASVSVVRDLPDSSGLSGSCLSLSQREVSPQLRIELHDRGGPVLGALVSARALVCTMVLRAAGAR